MVQICKGKDGATIRRADCPIGISKGGGMDKGEPEKRQQDQVMMALKTQLQAEIKRKAEIVADGQDNTAVYWYYDGRVAAFRLALQLCDLINNEKWGGNAGC